MANDLMGELGLDVSEFEKALDRVGNKVTGKFAATMNSAAASFAKAFGAAAIARYIYSLRNLTEETDELRNKMISGSEVAENFNKSLEGSGAASGFFRRLGDGWDQFRVKAKTAVAEAIVGLKMAGEDFGNWISEHAGFGGGVHEERNQAKQDAQEDKELSRIKEEIRLKEDQIAFTQSKEVGTQQQILQLSRQQTELAALRIAKASRLAATGREELNDDLRAKGAAEAFEADRQLSIQKSLIAAKGQTREIVLQQSGLSGAAKEARIYAEYQQKIAQAIREGRADLAGQLQIQQALALHANAVAEHNMSPAQRREERRAARKFARDLRKTQAQEADQERRSKDKQSGLDSLHQKMGKPGHLDFGGAIDDARGRGLGPDQITPGSALDRYRARRRGAAQAGRDAGSAVLDSADAKKFYTQGLQDLDAIKGAIIGVNKNQ